MWDPLDRLGVIVIDAGFASIALLSIVTVAMSVSRQPARRLRLAHAAMFGLLAFLPLIGLRLVPRFDVLAYVSGLGILPHPVLTPATGMLDSLARTGIAFGPWPLRVIVLLYGVGVVAGLFRLVLGHAAVLWIERGSTIPSSSAVELFESLPFAAGRRKPSLRVTSRVRRPMAVGTFRPMILIPADLDGAGMEATNRLKLCLLHELAHVEASDPWFRLIGNVARVFWYFLPPLWWISSQIRLDQEFLADRKAALIFGPFRVYASSLVELATVPVAAVKRLPARRVRGGESGSPLFQRVVMLLRCPFPLEPNPPRGPWCRYIL